MAKLGEAFRRTEVMQMIEAKCMVTVLLSDKARAKIKTVFTKGEIYIASISAKGNYILDTDGGTEKSLSPDQFHEYFKIIG